MTMLAEVVDAVIGIDTHPDTHEVEVLIGTETDRGDAHMLTDTVRTDSHRLRAVAGDSPDAEAVKVVARTHKDADLGADRQVQRLRHQLREYFPAALEAFDDMAAPDALELLGKAPPARHR